MPESQVVAAHMVSLDPRAARLDERILHVVVKAMAIEDVADFAVQSVETLAHLVFLPLEVFDHCADVVVTPRLTHFSFELDQQFLAVALVTFEFEQTRDALLGRADRLAEFGVRAPLVPGLGVVPDLDVLGEPLATWA